MFYMHCRARTCSSRAEAEAFRLCAAFSRQHHCTTTVCNCLCGAESIMPSTQVPLGGDGMWSVAFEIRRWCIALWYLSPPQGLWTMFMAQAQAIDQENLRLAEQRSPTVCRSFRCLWAEPPRAVRRVLGSVSVGCVSNILNIQGAHLSAVYEIAAVVTLQLLFLFLVLLVFWYWWCRCCCCYCNSCCCSHSCLLWGGCAAAAVDNSALRGWGWALPSPLA